MLPTKVQEIFPTKRFLGTNLNTTVSIVNMCRNISYTQTQNAAHVQEISGTYCKYLEFVVKCRKHYSNSSSSKYKCTLIFISYFLETLEWEHLSNHHCSRGCEEEKELS